jgi:PII interaction protein X
MAVFQLNKVSKILEKTNPIPRAVEEKDEHYLTHPTWGLLYSVCELEDNVELFTTLYANRLFFLVTNYAAHLKFESIGRQEARLIVEKRLCELRRYTQSQEYDKLMAMYQRTFN